MSETVAIYYYRMKTDRVVTTIFSNHNGIFIPIVNKLISFIYWLGRSLEHTLYGS